MGALALRLLGAAAGSLGLSLPLVTFLAGLALAAGPAGWAGYRIGHGSGFAGGSGLVSIATAPPGLSISRTRAPSRRRKVAA